MFVYGCNVVILGLQSNEGCVRVVMVGRVVRVVRVVRVAMVIWRDA